MRESGLLLFCRDKNQGCLAARCQNQRFVAMPRWTQTLCAFLYSWDLPTSNCPAPNNRPRRPRMRLPWCRQHRYLGEIPRHARLCRQHQRDNLLPSENPKHETQRDFVAWRNTFPQRMQYTIQRFPDSIARRHILNSRLPHRAPQDLIGLVRFE